MALSILPMISHDSHMFSTGMPTIFVSDMDRSVKFYVETLGLQLMERYGNHWASVATGNLRIGLHPESNQNRAGRNGSITIGFVVTGIEDAVSRLSQQGVRFQGPIAQDNAGKVVHFEDPDGHLLYIIELAWTGGSDKSWQKDYVSSKS